MHVLDLRLMVRARLLQILFDYLVFGLLLAFLLTALQGQLLDGRLVRFDCFLQRLTLVLQLMNQSVLALRSLTRCGPLAKLLHLL